MSYPSKLHVLIIEDEQEPIDSYLSLFNSYGAAFPSVTPTIARSYADAVARLNSDQFYHVVILDLNLPLTNGESPPDGLAPGQQLLELIARRETYPIPVCMVVSGQLRFAKLSDLQTRLNRDFWHGVTVNKGPDLPDELKAAFEKANQYSDVGIHLRDAGRAVFPTLSPREEDLLRRCVLALSDCIGVDLEWWAAELGPTLSRPTTDAGPTKVLMGRFCLDEARGFSQPTFFKFEPTGNTPFSIRDVKILEHKLSHVNLKHCGVSHERSLLVTQCVTNQRPLRLDEFLRSDPARPTLHVQQIVADIATQLDALGEATADHISVQSVLWSFHNRHSIQAGWGASVRDTLRQGNAGPMEVFDRVKASERKVWTKRRNCIHGDLNATNVALDESDASRPRAFIFDAAGVHADLACRDLAVLEVTAVLFLSDTAFEQHFHRLRSLYGPESASTTSDSDDTPTIIRNTVAFIRAIRGAVALSNDEALYTLLLFDAVLIQLGGLAAQRTHNKVAQAERVKILTAWISEWVSLSPLMLDAASAPQSIESRPPPHG